MPTLRPDLYETRRHKWVIRSCRCGLCKTRPRAWQALPPADAAARPGVFDTWAEALAYVVDKTALAEVQGPPAEALMVPAQRWFLPRRVPVRRGPLGLWW